jgi:hypothetical protein
MLHIPRLVLFALSGLMLIAADQAWKNKQYSEWTEDDAKEVIAGSPWVKTITPTVVKPPEPDQGQTGSRRPRGGISKGGPGRSGSDSPVGGQSSRPADGTSSPAHVPTLTLRWESALPVHEAELKDRETGAPTVDADHYALAVYGIPRSTIANDLAAQADELKKHAALKRYAKKDLKPSSVEILLRENGPVILYLFPKSSEITWRDQSVQFEAQVANLKCSQSFDTNEMRFHGNLEL